MKEQSVEELKKEIEKLKLQKEKELLLANTMKEKEKLMAEISMLKRAQKKPSEFKKNFMFGLKTTGKGLGYIWKGLQKASSNLEARDKGLQRVSKGNRGGAYSPETKMWLPEVKPTKRKSKKKVKVRVKTIPKRPRTRMVTKTVYSKPVKGSMPWELA